MKKIYLMTLIVYCFSIFVPNSYSDDPLRPISSIQAKVIPTIVYAQVLHDCNGFKAGEVVEILEDVGNGSAYRVTNGVLTTWIYPYCIRIIPSTPTSPPHLSHREVALYINHVMPSSPSGFYIWVDLARQQVNIFQQNKLPQWELIKQLACSSGKPSTPTVRGTFEISERGEILHGREEAKYWVKFYNNYLFHSFPITAESDSLGDHLGTPTSNGCIRLLEEDAFWIYENIPSTTPVWIY